MNRVDQVLLCTFGSFALTKLTCNTATCIAIVTAIYVYSLSYLLFAGASLMLLTSGDVECGDIRTGRGIRLGD